MVITGHEQFGEKSGFHEYGKWMYIRQNNTLFGISERGKPSCIAVADSFLIIQMRVFPSIGSIRLVPSCDLIALMTHTLPVH